MSVVQQVGDALVIYCAVIGVASVVVHAGVRPRWWTNLWGTHLMVYMVALASTFVLVALRVIVGASLDTPWYAVLRMVVFLLVPIAMTQRLAIQVGLRWHLGWPWHRRRTAAQDAEHGRAQAANRRPPDRGLESLPVPPPTGSRPPADGGPPPDFED